jgi:hypothetical protein
LSPALKALAWAGKGDWEQAHELVQDRAGGEMAWVHAYLHRVEDDVANADYWCRRAGRPVASGSLEEEWSAIAAALLAPDPSP